MIFVVGVLTDTLEPNKYWSVLKVHLKSEENETVTTGISIRN